MGICKIRLLLVIFVASIFLFSCEKSDDKMMGDMVSKKDIENLSATSTNEGVKLKWELADTDVYDEIEIWYNEDGEKKTFKKEVNGNKYSLGIQLSSKEVYKFFVQAKNLNGDNKSEIAWVRGRILTQKEDKEDIEDIFNSIKIYGGDGGVRIVWDNPRNIDAVVNVKYDDGNWSLPADSITKNFTIKGLDLGQTYTFEVNVSYGSDKTTTKDFIVTAKAAFGRLNTHGWTISPSSEETKTEDGRAINLLDDNPKTYWRSQVSPPTEKYPHYVIIDMKKVHDILGIALVRKEGDSDNSSWDMDYAFSKDGVNYSDTLHYYKTQSDPELAIEFNRTDPGNQMYILPKQYKARFIYVGFVRGGKDYAVTGDINVFGQ